MNFSQNSTKSDISNIDDKSQLEHQIQIQETNDPGGMFNQINSMKTKLYKTGELNGSTYVKFPWRSNAILKIENNDEYCFLWSILASLQPCKNDHSNRVSNYKQ